MKKGFTLIEVLVSVVLIGLIVVFLYNAIGILKTSNDSFSNKNAILKERDFLFSTLHRDIFESIEAKKLTTQNSDFDILKLKTKNSFHDIINPFVVYIVAKDEKRLLRLESSKEIAIPILADKVYELYADEMGAGVEIFKVYGQNADSNGSGETGEINPLGTEESALQDEAFLFLKIKEKEPIVFEVAK